MNETDDNKNNEKSAKESGSSRPIIPVSAKEALRPERVQQPQSAVRSKKSRSQVVIFLNFVMTTIVFITIAIGGVAYYALSEYSEPGPAEVNKNFLVRPGASVGDIANALERNNIVSDSRIFQYVSRVYLKGRTLKAGEYEIKAHASMREVADVIASGKSILYSVTIPEGLTTKQIFERLAADDMLDGSLPSELPPEGSLRPETYKFTRGTTRAEIVAQMSRAQSDLVDDIWSKREEGLPIQTKEEFVTLASIVEKETGKADERSRVAAVFLNRLNKGMRLQSDPTIIYGLFGGDGKPADRPIYQSDLKKETPYNTYVINGLPPTPIANPGRASLEAVANPSHTNDLYFVADGTGGHVFSDNLDDHNANVKRWRKIRAEQEAAGETQEGQ
ncbi:endolytic transglycosylase MltG [Rhizobium sp. L1K21]|uniref:endolytic transglycosylase MltG n=1 Tax=Rhizobium sp. L1K21 TaxID=2954933 RepID=UPI002093C6BB|nr:endolytic transglycosylase MltG [Rhizobium sp. L1K21]MCO6186523.1 endolytic transglycosylase MltG [Rhizobium sp. L1K21]